MPTHNNTPSKKTIGDKLPRGGHSRVSTGPALAFNLLCGLSLLLILSSLALIFFVAPVEAQMGIVQKIFYFHVPSACAMYIGFGICGLASAWYLFSRKQSADAWAVAGGEVGLMFCLIVLISGPLWARKAWGVYWTWDPRLTTTLLASLVFTAYVVLRNLGTGSVAERKFAAAIAVLGLVDLPVIHYSVQRWRGQHPTVITSKGGGLADDMVPALICSLCAFTALSLLLIWARARIEKQRNTLEALEYETVFPN